MRKQFYFKRESCEKCYTKEYFKDYMKENGITEIEVFEAIPEKINGIFWCKYYETCADRSYDIDSCGKDCKHYTPRNGKSGCCKYYSNILYTHGEKVTFKI